MFYFPFASLYHTLEETVAADLLPVKELRGTAAG